MKLKERQYNNCLLQRNLCQSESVQKKEERVKKDAKTKHRATKQMLESPEVREETSGEIQKDVKLRATKHLLQS